MSEYSWKNREQSLGILIQQSSMGDVYAQMITHTRDKKVEDDVSESRLRGRRDEEDMGIVRRKGVNLRTPLKASQIATPSSSSGCSSSSKNKTKNRSRSGSSSSEETNSTVDDVVQSNKIAANKRKNASSENDDDDDDDDDDNNDEEDDDKEEEEEEDGKVASDTDSSEEETEDENVQYSVAGKIKKIKKTSPKTKKVKKGPTSLGSLRNLILGKKDVERSARPKAFSSNSALKNSVKKASNTTYRRALRTTVQLEYVPYSYLTICSD